MAAHQTFSVEQTRPLFDAIGRSPEEGFRACGDLLGESKLLAMITKPPYSGAPLHGYIVPTIDVQGGRGQMVMACFMTSYFSQEAPLVRTNFFGVADVLALTDSLVVLNPTFYDFLIQATRLAAEREQQDAAREAAAQAERMQANSYPDVPPTVLEESVVDGVDSWELLSGMHENVPFSEA